MIERGLKASEWINSVTNLLDGKGGGRAESAQAIGNNPANVAQAMAKATEYARDKLGLTADAPVDAPTPAPAAAVVDNGMPTLYCAASSTRGSIVQVAARYAGKSLNVQTNGPLPSALTLSKVHKHSARVDWILRIALHESSLRCRFLLCWTDPSPWSERAPLSAT